MRESFESLNSIDIRQSNLESIERSTVDGAEYSPFTVVCVKLLTKRAHEIKTIRWILGMDCRQPAAYATVFVGDVQVTDRCTHAHKHIAFFCHPLGFSGEETL